MEKPAIEPVASAALSRMQEALARDKGASPVAGFADALKAALSGVDTAQHEAARLAERYQMGDQSVTLEDTMIALQKANLSFQAAVQVRNKVISAYHDIMNMQV